MSPADVTHWDRKALSFENYLSASGVSIDPGNFVYATTMYAIHLALGMDIPVSPDPRDEISSLDEELPLGWPRSGWKCPRHPLLTADTPGGISRKEGHSQPVTELLFPDSDEMPQSLAPCVALRLVLASLSHSEEKHRITLRDPSRTISTDLQERLGDVLEAAGGILSPYNSQVRAIMQSMHATHRITAAMVADAFKDFTAVLVRITELVRKLYNPAGDERSNIIKIIGCLDPAGLMLAMRQHEKESCWTCGELKALNAGHLLDPDAVPGARDSAAAGEGDEDAPGQDLSTASIKCTRHRMTELSDFRRPVSVTDGSFVEGHYYVQPAPLRSVQDQVPGSVPWAVPASGSEDPCPAPWREVEAGEIDASWFCVDCWHKLFKRRNPDITVEDTRIHLGLPPARRPADLPDNRFNYEKTGRWCKCDRCGAFCPAKARDYQPGSYVFCADNTIAGPDKDRSSCFPKPNMRSDLWTKGQWNATYACRRCLPWFWGCSRARMEEWLAFHHRGARENVRRKEAREWYRVSWWHRDRGWGRGGSWQQWQ